MPLPLAFPRRLGASLLLYCAPAFIPSFAREAGAQTRADSLQAEIDSLVARLARAEGAIALLRQQVATESQSTVHTQSRVSLDLSARILTNIALTRGATNDPGVPQSASPTKERARFLGLSLRQTRLGAAVTVHDVVGGTFDADVDMDFFGGGRDANGNRPLFPEPRLRTARGIVRWDRTAIMVGSDTPLISDLDPLSLASIGVTEFSGAGDLWNWLAQVRVTRRLNDGPVRFAVQGAVLAPFSSAVYEPTRAGGGDAGERSGKPFLESRVSMRWGGRGERDATPDAGLTDIRDYVVGEGPSEIAFGAHRGWVTIDDRNKRASRALSMDARIVIAPGVELRGEAYRGQLLLGLGGGGIGQNFGRPVPANGETPPVGAPLHDRAAWLQLNVRPKEQVLGGVGCGIDRVRDADLPDRRQNTVCAAHLRWTPMQPILLGIEYRRLQTLYSTGMYHANHINLAIGIEL